MTLHSDTQLYAAVVELCKFVARTVRHVRRDLKPLYGLFLVQESTWMAVLVRRANVAHGAAKAQPLTEILEQVESVQFILRLLRDLNDLPQKAWTESVPLTTSVAKQATALRNHFVPAAPPVS